MEDGSWRRELEGLFKFASSQQEALTGAEACFKLQLLGDHVHTDTAVLIRAIILASDGKCVGNAVHHAQDSGQTVLLRVRFGDWEVLRFRGSAVRAFWTLPVTSPDGLILDATVGPAFLAADAYLSHHETVQLAELYCGGFCGWSQAAWSISRHGPRITPTWQLDSCGRLAPFIRTMHPTTQLVLDPEDFNALDPQDPAFVCAKVQDRWWQRIWTLRPPHVATLSPPCQPWSTAGRLGGLHTEDGRLPLVTAKILEVVKVPVICMEEVQGFLQHSDFPEVMKAFVTAGYKKVWGRVLQLSEVAPTHRPSLGSSCLLLP